MFNTPYMSVQIYVSIASAHVRNPVTSLLSMSTAGINLHMYTSHILTSTSVSESFQKFTEYIFCQSFYFRFFFCILEKCDKIF